MAAPPPYPPGGGTPGYPPTAGGHPPAGGNGGYPPQPYGYPPPQAYPGYPPQQPPPTQPGLSSAPSYGGSGGYPGYPPSPYGGAPPPGGPPPAQPGLSTAPSYGGSGAYPGYPPPPYGPPHGGAPPQPGLASAPSYGGSGGHPGYPPPAYGASPPGGAPPPQPSLSSAPSYGSSAGYPGFPPPPYGAPPGGGQPGLAPAASGAYYPPPSQQAGSYGGYGAPGASGVYGPPGGGVGAAASEVVSLEFSARGLRDKDVLSKSDPLAVVFMRTGVPPPTMPGSAPPAQKPGGWFEVGRTEQIKNNLNPTFVTRIKVDYRFEQVQPVRIAVYDIDSRSTDLARHDALGEVETTLGNLVSSSPWTEALKYPNAAANKTLLGGIRQLGSLTVVAHEQSSTGRYRVRFQASAEKLPRMDFGGLGRSDPYLIVHQVISAGAGGGGGGVAGRKPVLSTVHTSEVVRSNSNPQWRLASFFIKRRPTESLGDIRLIMTIMDKDEGTPDDKIGEVHLTAAALSTASPAVFDIIHQEKKRRKGRRYTNSGKLRLSNVSVTALPTFVQYLQHASLAMRFIIAIDFTGSNGDPRTPQSLHSMADPTRPNEYVRALTAVGSVLASYDPTQQFAALGFGGELPGGGQRSVSHNFSLNGSANPYCAGIPGILGAYQRCLGEVRLSGPTYAAPIIRHAMQLARAPPPPGALSYYVLLLLTDGVLNDMDATVGAIIDACETPLSIAIVGVGGADFGNMRVLDADNVRLRGRDGRVASADIVQFTGFREQGGDPSGLAAEVLAEVPNRVVEYFVERGKLPRVPPSS